MLTDWLTDWLAGWLAGWLGCFLPSFLPGWLDSLLACLLTYLFLTCLLTYLFTTTHYSLLTTFTAATQNMCHVSFNLDSFFFPTFRPLFLFPSPLSFYSSSCYLPDFLFPGFFPNSSIYRQELKCGQGTGHSKGNCSHQNLPTKEIQIASCYY